MNESNMWKETDEEILQQIPEKLLKWYDQNARILPWRENPAAVPCMGVGDHAAADTCGSSQAVF